MFSKTATQRTRPVRNVLTSADAPAFLEISGVVKRYGAHLATDRVSLSVAKGECVALLGPSGCGKTTLLNVVAGFIKPDDGRVGIEGVDITALSPHRRNIGMVFQDYALFPHLSVVENVEFGLRMRRVGSTERRRIAEHAMGLVSLNGLGDRSVQQLSGGQRQRVAVARALAIEPQLLLFDEPLSNLDARLRDSMRTEIRSLLVRTRVTALFVTHDQAEAFAIADRIAIMNAGRIEQLGTPDEVYERPISPFVATFLGGCNLFSGRVRSVDGERVTIDALRTTLFSNQPRATGDWAPGQGVSVAIRPHRIQVRTGAASATPSENEVKVSVAAIEYLGSVSRTTATLECGSTITWEQSGRCAMRAGDQAVLTWSAADTRLMAGGYSR